MIHRSICWLCEHRIVISVGDGKFEPFRYLQISPTKMTLLHSARVSLRCCRVYIQLDELAVVLGPELCYLPSIKIFGLSDCIMQPQGVHVYSLAALPVTVADSFREMYRNAVQQFRGCRLFVYNVNPCLYELVQSFSMTYKRRR